MKLLRRIGVDDRYRKPSLQAVDHDADAGGLLRDDRSHGDEQDERGRDEERQRVEVEGDLDRGQRREQAGGREPDRRRAEAADRQEGVGCCELLVGGDVGDDALLRRIEELGDGRVDEDDDVEQVDVDRDDGRDRGHQDGPEQAGHDHDLLAVVAVDEHARDQPDDQGRQCGRREHQADGQRRTRRAVDQDARGKVGEGRAAGGDQLGEPEEREVALLEDGEHRRLRRRNSAGQGLLQLPCVYGLGRARRATVGRCRVTLGGPFAGV